jgi:uncharacterized membrane protein
VADATAAGGPYLETGRAVPVGHGVEWIASGWRMFKRQAGVWVLLALVFALIFIGLSFVPIVGQLAVTLLTPVFVGGMMLGCRRAANGEEIELGDLFAGFRHSTGTLVMVGLIALGLVIAIMVVVMVMTGASMLAAFAAPSTGLSSVGVMLSVLLMLALAIPVNMAMWFAPALVVLNGQSAPRALLQSFKASLKNIVPFLVYGIVLFFLAILASIPAGLGWLVLGPVLVASVYAAYRDIFFEA